MLNQTNGMALVDAFTDEMDSWVGQVIEVWQVDTEYNGETRKGVRIGPFTPALPPAKDDLDDDTPF